MVQVIKEDRVRVQGMEEEACEEDEEQQLEVEGPRRHSAPASMLVCVWGGEGERARERERERARERPESMLECVSE